MAPLLFDLGGKRVYVAGHSGLAGSAILRRLASEGCELLTADRAALDLTNQEQTENWIAQARPDVIFLAAARVGGIYANDTVPAEFLADNLAIALNVMRAAVAAKVKKLMFLGSSCVFPRNAPQPMTEDLLLTGALEPTNEWYAVAKIAGIKLAQAYRRQYGADFISVMPTNLYGPGDNYHPDNSHVPAALIRRFHEAKVRGADEVVVWGTGEPKREFMAADDLGDAHVGDVFGSHDAIKACVLHLLAAEAEAEKLRQPPAKLRDELRAVVVAAGFASGEKDARFGWYGDRTSVDFS